MKKLLKFAPLAMVGLAVLALVMFFLPQLSYSNDWVDANLKGADVVFGLKEGNYESLKFSFLNLLTYLLVIGMAVCAVLAFVKNNKTALLVAIALAVVAAVFFFLTQVFTVGANEIVTEAIKEYSLGVGAILGGIFSILAAGVGVAKVVLDK